MPANSEKDSVLTAGPEILIDFPSEGGLIDVTSRPDVLAERSASAIDAAMGTIHEFADRVQSTVSRLVVRPAEVDVEFGIKLDAEAGALIAKTRIEAHIVVTLKWNSDDGGNGNGANTPSET